MFGRQTKIPKQFRAPRPTSLEMGRSERWLRMVPIEAVSALISVALVAWLPLSGLQRVTESWLLHSNTVASAPKTTMVVRVAPEAAGLARCERELDQLATEAGATGIVWVAPTDRLCPARGQVRVPRVVWQEDWVRRDSAGRVVAISAAQSDGHALSRLAQWPTDSALVPFDLSSVPTARLSQLADGQVPLAVLQGRTLVVELDGQANSPALEVAAALAAAQEGGQRHHVPRWELALLSMLLSLSVALLGRRRLELSVVLALGQSVVLGAGAFLLVRFVEVSLLPLGHLLIAQAVATGILWVPRWFASRTALHHAGDLVERAALMRSEGIHLLADEEFWPRLGDLASQAHPADSVLIAEVPPRQWHLRFWPYRGQGENVVSERRRDMRRTPYSDEQGVPGICVTHRFLVMEGVPTVVVPLIALGEVEGYVFLLGDKAKQAHLEVPELAERMSTDLGFLLRRRRVGEANQRGYRRTTQRGYWNASASSAKLVEGAEVAVGDLKMFGSLIRNAPIGLLYADAFGHVRIVSSDVVQWLSDIGVSVPTQSADAPLSPGSLRLGTVLTAMAKLGHKEVSLVELAREGARSSFAVPGSSSAASHRFTIRALHEESDGVSWIAGYVGALVEGAAEPAAGAEGRLLPFRGQPETDSLSVRSLADTAQASAKSAMAQVGKPVRFEPARYPGYAIGYHDELRDSLIDLLCELAPRDPTGKGPVVAVSEDESDAALTILDLQFGLPLSALKRVLLAPSDPPAGLEVFGRFVRSVVESHGAVKISEDEWGLSVVATLLRARPLRRLPSMRPSAMAPSKNRRTPSG